MNYSKHETSLSICPGFVFSSSLAPWPTLTHHASSHTPLGRLNRTRRITTWKPFSTLHYQPVHPAVTVSAAPSSSSQSSGSTILSAVEGSGCKVSPLVDVTTVDPATLRGLSVVSPDGDNPILKGTQLAEVPATLVLTPRLARTLLQKTLPNAFRATLDELSDAAVMALALLRERATEADSTLAPLLRVLPPAHGLHCAPLWTDAQLGFLQGSTVRDAALRVRSGVEDEFGDIVDALKRAGEKDNGDADSWLTLDGYRWALAVVDSRSTRVSQRDALVLAPVSAACRDAAPGVAPTVEAQLAGGGMFGGGGGANRRLVLRLARDVHLDGDDGEMMTMAVGLDGTAGDAGDGGNIDRLLERGEAYEAPEAATVDMMFDIAAIDPFRSDKEDVVEMAGLETNMRFRLCGPNARGKWTPPDGFDSFLRLLCMGGTDAFLLEAVFRGQVWDFMQLPVSKENEQAMCSLVIATCEDALEAYNDNAPDDGSGDDEMTAVRRKLANIVVRAEKETLQAVRAKYEKIEQSLDVLEYYAERRLDELDLLRPLSASEIVDSDSASRMGQAFDDNYR